MSTLQPPPGVTAEAWAKIARLDGNRWAIVERDASGEKIGTAYRDASGGKTSRTGGKRGLILPWPLPAYAGSTASNPVYIAEGASDTAALLTLGFDAVGVPMAGHCGMLLAHLMKNRHVVLVADADTAGRRGASKIAARLVEQCESVRIIEPPGGAKDVREAVVAGSDRAAFESLAAVAPLFEPDNSDKPVRPQTGTPVLVRLADVTPEPVRWLWQNRIPRGRLSLLVGRPGEGKSFATADWAARVTTGHAWPDGSPCEQGSVLLVSAEDDPADTIRPRLDAHGADVSRVHFLRGVHCIGPGGKPCEAMFTLADLPALEAALAAMDVPGLCVIDPIGSFLGSSADAHRDNEVRGVLAPLGLLAQKTGVAIVLVAHQRKSAASHADDTVLGSRAFTGIARSVLHLMRDPDDDERRLLLPGKSNLARPADGLAFRIDGDPPRLVWEEGTVAATADAVLAAHAGGGSGTSSALDEAKEWLRDTLIDGPVPAVEVKNQAEADGIALRTLQRAKQVLNVVATKEGYAAKGRWVWVMPHSAPA